MPAAVYQGSTGFGLYRGATKDGMHQNPTNWAEAERTMHHGARSLRAYHGSTKPRTHHDSTGRRVGLPGHRGGGRKGGSTEAAPRLALQRPKPTPLGPGKGGAADGAAPLLGI